MSHGTSFVPGVSGPRDRDEPSTSQKGKTQSRGQTVISFSELSRLTVSSESMVPLKRTPRSLCQYPVPQTSTKGSRGQTVRLVPVRCRRVQWESHEYGPQVGLKCLGTSLVTWLGRERVGEGKVLKHLGQVVERKREKSDHVRDQEKDRSETWRVSLQRQR